MNSSQIRTLPPRAAASPNGPDMRHHSRTDAHQPRRRVPLFFFFFFSRIALILLVVIVLAAWPVSWPTVAPRARDAERRGRALFPPRRFPVSPEPGKGSEASCLQPGCNRCAGFHLLPEATQKARLPAEWNVGPRTHVTSGRCLAEMDTPELTAARPARAQSKQRRGANLQLPDHGRPVEMSCSASNSVSPNRRRMKKQPAGGVGGDFFFGGGPPHLEAEAPMGPAGGNAVVFRHVGSAFDGLVTVRTWTWRYGLRGR